MSASAPRELPTRRPRSPTKATTIVAAFGGAPDSGNQRLRELAIETIAPNPHQPRQRFDSESLQRLAASLGERGVLQPILVRPTQDPERFELIAGERRWRAAQLAELTHLPAFVRGDTEDALALELALTENAAREDLTPVEQARALSTLIDDLNITQQTLAARIGMSAPALSNTKRLVNLPDQVLDLLDNGRLTRGHGIALLALPDYDTQTRLGRQAAREGWSVRQLETAARNHGPDQRAPATPTPVATVDLDLQAAAQALADETQRRLNTEVTVKPRRGGLSIEISASDLDHARALLKSI